jgi:hypothetical protein
MSGRLRLIVVAALLSAAAGGLWHWQAARKEAALARHDRWMAYLQGPLSDLLYGSSRLRPLMGKKNWSPADTAEAKEALQHLVRSASLALAASLQFKEDPRLQPLVEAVALHQEMQTLMVEWVERRGPGTLAAEAQIRLRLWTLLTEQRERMRAEGTLNRDEVLEMNALLYSLQEETGQAGQP